ncbi:MAG: hypothetical protein JWO57_2997, partial [Pseudonocardiales bacterium]|nr:hypothetical protein [Pseudonocardiales bacterium]
MRGRPSTRRVWRPARPPAPSAFRLRGGSGGPAGQGGADLVVQSAEVVKYVAALKAELVELLVDGVQSCLRGGLGRLPFLTGQTLVLHPTCRCFDLGLFPCLCGVSVEPVALGCGGGNDLRCLRAGPVQFRCGVGEDLLSVGRANRVEFR